MLSLNTIILQQQLVLIRKIMKKILLILVSLLLKYTGYTQNKDNLFFDFNKALLKEIKIPIENDRLYLISKPEIQASVHFQIVKTCKTRLDNKYGLEVLEYPSEVLDIKEYLSKNNILSNSQSLFISFNKFYEFLKLVEGKTLFFIKVEGNIIEKYMVIPIWEEV